ncbi:hypothetical protein OSTOST_14071, partial [Ostertagia ostertagi]
MFERLCGCCSRGASSSEDVIRGEEERRLRANDRVFNSQFKYAVRKALQGSIPGCHGRS